MVCFIEYRAHTSTHNSIKGIKQEILDRKYYFLSFYLFNNVKPEKNETEKGDKKKEEEEEKESEKEMNEGMGGGGEGRKKGENTKGG